MQTNYIKLNKKISSGSIKNKRSSDIIFTPIKDNSSNTCLITKNNNKINDDKIKTENNKNENYDMKKDKVEKDDYSKKKFKYKLCNHKSKSIDFLDEDKRKNQNEYKNNANNLNNGNYDKTIINNQNEYDINIIDFDTQENNYNSNYVFSKSLNEKNRMNKYYDNCNNNFHKSNYENNIPYQNYNTYEKNSNKILKNTNDYEEDKKPIIISCFDHHHSLDNKEKNDNQEYKSNNSNNNNFGNNNFNFNEKIDICSPNKKIQNYYSNINDLKIYNSSNSKNINGNNKNLNKNNQNLDSINYLTNENDDNNNLKRIKKNNSKDNLKKNTKFFNSNNHTNINCFNSINSNGENLKSTNIITSTTSSYYSKEFVYELTTLYNKEKEDLMVKINRMQTNLDKIQVSLSNQMQNIQKQIEDNNLNYSIKIKNLENQQLMIYEKNLWLNDQDKQKDSLIENLKQQMKKLKESNTELLEKYDYHSNACKDDKILQQKQFDELQNKIAQKEIEIEDLKNYYNKKIQELNNLSTNIYKKNAMDYYELEINNLEKTHKVEQTESIILLQEIFYNFN